MERRTRQREAIREVLLSTDRPLAPAEVLSRAERRVPGLSLATVYRSIRALLDERVITAIELPGAPARYEPAGLDHHHHFSCRGCGRVYDVHGCPGTLDALAPPGFRVESHEITLTGLCDRCSG